MNFGRRKHPGRFMHVEITPMIDVVFLLIIFFMTTAQFARLTRENVDLPRERGEQEEKLEESGLVINITADGRIIVASESIELEDLEALVLDEVERQPGKRPEEFKLLLRADRNADSTTLNQVVETLHELGIGAARVATEVPR